MPVRNWIVYSVAFLFAVGATWAFIAARAVPEVGKRAVGNHGFQGNTVPSYVKIHGNDAAGRTLAKP
jgi:hypothetical protein